MNPTLVLFLIQASIDARAADLAQTLIATGVSAAVGLLIALLLRVNRIYNLLFEPKRGLVDEMDRQKVRGHDLLDVAINHRYRIRRLEDAHQIETPAEDDDMALLRRRRSTDT